MRRLACTPPFEIGPRAGLSRLYETQCEREHRRKITAWFYPKTKGVVDECAGASSSIYAFFVKPTTPPTWYPAYIRPPACHVDRAEQVCRDRGSLRSPERRLLEAALRPRASRSSGPRTCQQRQHPRTLGGARTGRRRRRRRGLGNGSGVVLR